MPTDNSQGFVALRAMIDKVAKLGALPEECAPIVAERLHDITVENIAAGVGPDGKPWALTKEGKRPLQNAAKALSHGAVGTVAILRLQGPEVRHHSGTARGQITRRILPTRTLTAPVVEAIRRATAEKFREIVEG